MSDFDKLQRAINSLNSKFDKLNAQSEQGQQRSFGNKRNPNNNNQQSKQSARRSKQKLKQAIARELNLDTNRLTELGRQYQESGKFTGPAGSYNSLAKQIVGSVIATKCPGKLKPDFKQAKYHRIIPIETEESKEWINIPETEYETFEKLNKIQKSQSVKRGLDRVEEQELKSELQIQQSLLYPEKQIPIRLPSGHMATAVGTWSDTVFMSPIGVNTEMMGYFMPKNLNGGTMIAVTTNGTWSAAAGMTPATTPNATRAGNFAASTSIESLRVTSACVIIDCVGNQQTTQGLVTIGYQPNISFNGTDWLNSTFREIEMASIKNGQTKTAVECLNGGSVKAIWYPRDEDDKIFAQTGHAADLKTFIGWCVTGTNSSNIFRIRYFINFEYIPGSATENLVQVQQSDLADVWDSTVNKVGEGNPVFNAQKLEQIPFTQSEWGYIPRRHYY
jgi:hypothetical protein